MITHSCKTHSFVCSFVLWPSGISVLCRCRLEGPHLAVICQFSLLLFSDSFIHWSFIHWSLVHSIAASSSWSICPSIFFIHFLSLFSHFLVTMATIRPIARPPFSAVSFQADFKRAMATSFSATPCSCALATMTYTCHTRTCHRRYTFVRWPRRKRSNNPSTWST